MNNIYQLMNWVENNRGIAVLIVLYAQFVILFTLYMYVRLKSPAGRGKLDGGKILIRSRNMQIALSPPSLPDEVFLHTTKTSHQQRELQPVPSDSSIPLQPR